MKRLNRYTLGGFLAIYTTAMFGQTTTDLSRQGKFALAASLPPHCATGQAFIKAGVPSGGTLYICTASDTWTAVAVPALGGDLAGAPDAASVKAIQGRAVSNASPADQNVLRWNATSAQWEPGQAPNAITAGNGIAISGDSISVEDAVIPEYFTGLGAPSISCTAGRDFYVDAAAGSLYFCKGAGQWQRTAGIASTGAVLKGDGAGNAAAAAAGVDYEAPPSAVVTSGSAPVCDLGSAGNIARCEHTLSTNAAATFAHLKAGAKFSWAWTQGGAGGFTVSYSGASNTCAVSPVPNATTVQQFEVAADGISVAGTGCSISEAGVVYRGPGGAAPGTPASGVVCWVDSTANRWQCKDSTGTVYSATVGISSDPGDHKTVTYIDQAGVQHRAQPGSSDLSDNSSIQHDTEPLRLQLTAGPGGVAANSLCKVAPDGTAVPATGGEGVLGICMNAAAAGNPVKIAIAGAASCTAEGTIQQNHYIVAGTLNASRCRDSGQTSLAAIAQNTSVAGRAVCGTATCAADGQAFVINLGGPGTRGTLTTGDGPYLASASGIPPDGCAAFSGGNIGSTGTPCGSGSGAVSAGAGIKVSGSYVFWNPMDTSMDWLYDNFAPAGIGTTNYNIGLLRWNWTGSSASAPACSGVHCGLFSWATSTTANNVTALTQWASGNGGQFLPIGGGPFAATNWEFKWIFKTPAVSTNVKVRIGMSGSNVTTDSSDATGAGLFLRYSNDGGTGCTLHGTDAGWVAYAADGSNAVSGSLGNFLTNTWYTLDVKSTVAGTIVFSLTPDGGSTSTATLVASSGSPGTVVTQPGYPLIQTVTCDTTAKTIVVDDFRWMQTGIAR